MATVRIQNERIPKGRYWVDVFERNRVPFEAWLSFAVKSNLGRSTHTETREDGSSFVIFKVTSDGGAPWPSDESLPPVNDAPSTIQSSADTIDRPEPEKDPTDKLIDGAADVVDGAKLATGIVLTLVGLGLVWAFRKGG